MYCCLRLMTGNVMGEVALPRNATGLPAAHDVCAGRQAIYRAPDRGRQSACGAHSVPLAARWGSMSWLMAAYHCSIHAERR